MTGHGRHLRPADAPRHRRRLLTQYVKLARILRDKIESGRYRQAPFDNRAPTGRSGRIGPRHPAGANEHISGQYGRAALPLNVSRPGPVVFASVTLAWTAGPEPPRVRRSCTSYRHGLEPERVAVVVGRLDSLTRGVAQVAAKRLARAAWRYACQGRFGYPGRRCDLLVAVPPGAVRPRKRSEGDTASGTHTERHGRAVGLRRAIRVRA